MFNILICDDDREIVDAIAIYLETEGYGVMKAYNGLEALQTLEKNEIHLLIMDIMMPEMDGIETMKKLKEMGFANPIVALTADAMDGSREKYLSAGFDDYLSKPIDQMTITETLEKFLKLKVISQEDADNRRNNYIDPNVGTTTNNDDVEML